jgi:hypothetical protein
MKTHKGGIFYGAEAGLPLGVGQTSTSCTLEMLLVDMIFLLYHISINYTRESFLKRHPDTKPKLCF